MTKHLTTINNAIAKVEKLKAEVEKVKDHLQSEYDALSLETQHVDRRTGVLCTRGPLCLVPLELRMEG